ncbi:C4-dicarboxylate transport protein [Alphaproteobacteria bacterium]|nr:C4-dicarboxylate transport protein [Alphaproteobacteria bacterium]
MTVLISKKSQLKKILNTPLYLQVLVAIFLAVAFAIIFPGLTKNLKLGSDIFIKLIKMCIPLIIFFTITLSFIGDDDIKIGRLAVKSIIYFEIITTLAMIIGIASALIFLPGDGMHMTLEKLDKSDFGDIQKPKLNFSQFILNIIPSTVIEAFTNGEILPILLIAIIFGLILSKIKDQVSHSIKLLREGSKIVFLLINYIIKLAPIAVFCAISYTIGKYGLKSLSNMFEFVLLFYATCIFFIVVIFGMILALCRQNIFKLLNHLRSEILIVLGSSSSEVVLPNMLKKMEEFGCKKSVVNFVIPSGYAFNLDGTCIYFTMAILFIAQAFDIYLTIPQIVELLMVLLITSKGASAVVGSAFITLSATLAVMPTVPVEGMILILGIDRFMSEGRAVTNLIGNATAAVVMDRLQKK